jgi:hypothetical protein
VLTNKEIGKLQNYLLAMIGSNHELEIRLSVIKTLLDDMRAGAKFVRAMSTMSASCVSQNQ